MAQSPALLEPCGLEPSTTSPSQRSPGNSPPQEMDLQTPLDNRELTHSFIQMLNYFHTSKSGCAHLVLVICQFNFGGEGRRRGGDSWDCAGSKPQQCRNVAAAAEQQVRSPALALSPHPRLAMTDSRLCSRPHADIEQTWHQYKMSLRYGIFQVVPELDPCFRGLFAKPVSPSHSLNARANLETWLFQICVKLLDWEHVSFLHMLVILTNFYCWGNQR